MGLICLYPSLQLREIKLTCTSPAETVHELEGIFCALAKYEPNPRLLRNSLLLSHWTRNHARHENPDEVSHENMITCPANTKKDHVARYSSQSKSRFKEKAIEQFSEWLYLLTSQENDYRFKSSKRSSSNCIRTINIKLFKPLQLQSTKETLLLFSYPHFLGGVRRG